MSSLRKWFSSNSMLGIVQIYFCLTAIGTFVQAEYYNVTSVNTMSLDDSRNELNIFGSALLFIKRDGKNSYTAQLEQTNIIAKNFRPDMSVSDCDEFKPVATALRKPFKVLLNDNAQFKSMKVSKDDLDLSIALKFLAATALQANKKKIQGQTGAFNFKGTAVSQYGKCTSNNKGSIGKNGNYELKSFIQADTCSGLESVSKDDQQFTDSVCRTEFEGDLWLEFFPWHRSSVNSEANNFRKVEVGSKLSYVPRKDTDEVLSTFSAITFVRQTGSSRDPEPFNDADSKELTELQYINIDRSMVRKPRGNKALLFYKKIICQPVKKNTFSAVLRIAALCRK